MPAKKAMPAIRQRKDRQGNLLDSWECRISTGQKNPATGQPIRVSISGTTFDECQQKAIAALAELQVGTYAAPNRTTLKAWMNTWLREWKSNGSVKPATLTTYESIIRVHLAAKLGGLPLKDLRPEHLQTFFNGMAADGLAGSTVRLSFVILDEALTQARLNRMIAFNSCEGVTLPKGQRREMRVFTQAEQAKFMAAATAQADGGMMFRLLAATGLRRGELLALTWRNVDLKAGILTVAGTLQRVKDFSGKGGKTVLRCGDPKTEDSARQVPIPAAILAELKAYRDQQRRQRVAKGLSELYDGKIFTNRKGGAVEPSNFNRRFAAIVKAAGLPAASPHALRHSYATRCIESGIEAKTVSDLLGHSSVTFTLDKYGHTLPEAKRAAVDRIEALF